MECGLVAGHTRERRHGNRLLWPILQDKLYEDSLEKAKEAKKGQCWGKGA